MYGLTKFRSTLIKPYFISSTSINDNQPMPKRSILWSISASTTEKGPAKASLTEELLIYAFTTSIPLASLTLIYCGCRKPRKYMEQVNITIQSDICFLMSKFNTFINKNADA